MAKKDVLERGVKVALQFLLSLQSYVCLIMFAFYKGLASVLCDNVDENILNMHQVNNCIADFHEN